jgi:Tol biopolymer transport system component
MRHVLTVSALLVLEACLVPDPHRRDRDRDGDGPDVGDSVDWDEVEPLGEHELAYMTYSDGAYDTLRIVDVRTGESRELADIEGAGDGFGLTALAMAPDRRSVAFSAYFRLEESGWQPDRGMPHPGIWRVDASGEDFQMIAPPLPQMEGSACDIDADCAPLGMECNQLLGTCQLEAATYITDDLAFSADGEELWFTYGTYWLDGYYLAGGTTLASVDADYGESSVPEVHAKDTSCTQISDLAMHPDGDSMLALQSVCLDGGDEGVFRYDLPGLDARRAVPTPEGFDITLTTPDWFPDGSGFVFVVYGGWDEDGDGWSDWYADGLVQYDVDSDEVSLISAMPEGYSILDPSISPDGTQIAMCVSGGGGSDLYLVDLEAWTQEPLTEHGASCKPSW